ncbi:hypothetical protein ACOL3H_07135 [Aliarcobacter butzleri]
MKKSFLKELNLNWYEIHWLRIGQLTFKSIIFSSFIYYLLFNFFLNNFSIKLNYLSESLTLLFLIYILTVKYFIFNKLLEKYNLFFLGNEKGGGFELKNKEIDSDNMQ